MNKGQVLLTEELIRYFKSSTYAGRLELAKLWKVDYPTLWPIVERRTGFIDKHKELK